MDARFFRSHTAQVFRAQGLAQGVVRALAVRGMEVSDEVRERIEACEDIELAEAWLVRAMKVGRAEDVFEGTID
jgi:hypothetical protein